jgi:signal transduction histidine kinase
MVIAAFNGVLAYSAMSIAPNDLVSWGLGTFPAALVIVVLLPAGFGGQAIYVIAMTSLLYLSLVAAAWNASVTLVTSIELQLKHEALARANAEIAARAEQANRDKSAFLAAVSHGLRQPVHALLLLIEAYRQQTPEAAKHPLMAHIGAANRLELVLKRDAILSDE